ncbi:calcium/calmodulin-dependent protein kinase [Paramyrothecium foliicola]|nr:calcium/calmodulin-dependent protein kinase [Paramyrothecium foliicola]
MGEPAMDAPPNNPAGASPPSHALRSPTVTVHDHDEAPVPNVTPLSDRPRSSSFVSPPRQHKRTPSVHREVKETLDARVEFASDDYDGRTHHRINQYTIHDEIGRGSFSAVHLAKDQYGTEYAIKEFSKARLRKRAQSNFLRQGTPRPRRLPGGPFALPRGQLQAPATQDALYLIREEIAIMKKLNHPNLVQLIEVLDDPEEDSLYMVMEMCKKGVIMKVGLESQAAPYTDDDCRCWFRDMILGIEYLHAQGVIHRDIKPDNLLVSEDNVLKIVDFGVSEMFGKPENMRTAKSAGSPAFLPPELCGKHDEVLGTAADIWSMGVSLYCLRYGRIPFNRDSMMEIYEAIKKDSPYIPDGEDPEFVDLMMRILEKDPEKRITMLELRDHPWVTNGGTAPLLSVEDNCAEPIEAPNELELSRAITRKMNHLLCVMKVMNKFKTRLAKKNLRTGSDSASSLQSSLDPAEEKARAEEIEAIIAQRKNLLNPSAEATAELDDSPETEQQQQPLILGIGTGARDAFAQDDATSDVVADSPTAVDFDVYDRAYKEAVERHMNSRSTEKPTMYLTKFVKDREPFRGVANVVDGSDGLTSLLPQVANTASSSLRQASDSPSGADKLVQLTSKIAVSGSV